jgi:hypothetical protein
MTSRSNLGHRWVLRHPTHSVGPWGTWRNFARISDQIYRHPQKCSHTHRRWAWRVQLGLRRLRGACQGHRREDPAAIQIYM